jgi:hypothetical protein
MPQVGTIMSGRLIQSATLETFQKRWDSTYARV